MGLEVHGLWDGSQWYVESISIAFSTDTIVNLGRRFPRGQGANLLGQLQKGRLAQIFL